MAHARYAHSIDSLSDDILNDVYHGKLDGDDGVGIGSSSNSNYRQNYEKRQQKKRANVGSVSLPVLDSYHSMESSVSSLKQVGKASEVDSIGLAGPQRLTHMIHKIAATSGAIPGNEGSESVKKANKSQLQSIEESPSIKRGLANVLMIYDELNLIVQDLFYRKDLSSRVQIANDAYLVLFQSLMGEVLSNQRDKFRFDQQEYDKMKYQVKQLLTDLAGKNSSMQEMRDRIEVLDSINNNLEVRLQTKTQEYDISQAKIATEERLKAQDPMKYMHENFATQVMEIKSKFKKQCDETLASKVAELKQQLAKETSQYSLDRARLQKRQMADEKAKRNELVQEEVQLILKSGAFHQKEVEGEKPEYLDMGTQTEVDDLGLWDVADGWVLPISKSVEVRRKWRRAFEFARCPNCRGVGGFVAKCAVLLKKAYRGKLSPQEEHLQSRRKANWVLTDDIVQFLRHLPKSLLAERSQSVSWVACKVLHILNFKQQADLVDSEVYRRPYQSLQDFLIELFLLTEKNKKLAELSLYRFLHTLGDYFVKHPLLQVFARFLGILNSSDNSDRHHFLSQQHFEVPSPGTARSTHTARDAHLTSRQGLQGSAADGCPQSARAVHQSEQTAAATSTIGGYTSRVIYASPEKSHNKKQHNKRRNAVKHDEHISVSDVALVDTVFLPAYLYLRCCLWHPYEGIYADRLAEIEQRAQYVARRDHLLGQFSNPATGEASGLASIPKHVVFTDDMQCYIPLDRVVRVLSNVFSEPSVEKTSSAADEDFVAGLSNAQFRSPKKGFIDSVQHPPMDLSHKSAVLKTLESTCRFLEPTSGCLHQPEIMHITVLAQLRRLELFQPPNAQDMRWEEIEQQIALSKQRSLALAAAVPGDSGGAGALALAAGDNPDPDEFLSGDSSANPLSFQQANKDFQFLIFINQDHFIQILMEELIRRNTRIETAIFNLFHACDENHDGLLGFNEFVQLLETLTGATPQGAVHRRLLNKRSVLSMFRAAHHQSDHCTDTMLTTMGSCMHNSIGINIQGLLHVLRVNGFLSVVSLSPSG
jgi:hypothetical protein